MPNKHGKENIHGTGCNCAGIHTRLRSRKQLFPNSDLGPGPGAAPPQGLRSSLWFVTRLGTRHICLASDEPETKAIGCNFQEELETEGPPRGRVCLSPGCGP